MLDGVWCWVCPVVWAWCTDVEASIHRKTWREPQVPCVGTRAVPQGTPRVLVVVHVGLVHVMGYEAAKWRGGWSTTVDTDSAVLIGGVCSIAQIFSFFASLGFENAEDDTVGNFDDLTPAVRNRVAHFCGLLCVSIARVFVA